MATILTLVAVFGHEVPEENAAPADGAALSAADVPRIGWIARVDSETKVSVGPSVERIAPPPAEAQTASVGRLLRQERQHLLAASRSVPGPNATIPWVGIRALRL